MDIRTFSKFKNARKVVFAKDFGKHYKAGETHYIHNDIVEKKKLAKVAKVSTIDFEGEFEKIRTQKEKAEKFKDS